VYHFTISVASCHLTPSPHSDSQQVPQQAPSATWDLTHRPDTRLPLSEHSKSRAHCIATLIFCRSQVSLIADFPAHR
jgi:hypothetical protein